MNPEISILIPTTGRIELVREALRSALEQDFRDIEVVITNVENSEEIKNLIRKVGDSRVRHEPLPVGDSPIMTWDVVARKAKGNYVLWLDDDNYLMPGALSLFISVAKRTGADVVSATHLYYYDSNHSRKHLRGAMGVLPFNGEEYEFDPAQIITNFFAFNRRLGPQYRLPRVHPSAVFISRSVVEKALKELGVIIFPDLPNVSSFHPALFIFAKKGVHIDYPVVVVGRLGVSMSQVWSTAARLRFKKKPFIARLSPVKGYTRINGMLENYLRLKEKRPDLYGRFPIGYSAFAPIYLEEIRYLDMDIGYAISTWKDAAKFVHSLPEDDQRKLLPRLYRYAALYPFIYLSRRLGLHHVWRLIKKDPTPDPKVAFSKKVEFSIPLTNYQPIDVGGVAHNAYRILEDTIGPILKPPKVN